MQHCGFPHFFVERALWLLHRMWIQRCSSEKNKQHWLRTWNQIQALFLLQMTGGWCFFLLPWSFFTYEISNNFALINGEESFQPPLPLTSGNVYKMMPKVERLKPLLLWRLSHLSRRQKLQTTQSRHCPQHPGWTGGAMAGTGLSVSKTIHAWC